MPIYRLGELFCGPGGLACGAMNANIGIQDYKIVHQWATDYDLSTCETYIHNICPDNPTSVVCEDVRKLDIAKLGDIDSLAFGFPCNDFSVIGEKKVLMAHSDNFISTELKHLNYTSRIGFWLKT